MRRRNLLAPLDSVDLLALRRACKRAEALEGLAQRRARRQRDEMIERLRGRSLAPEHVHLVEEFPEDAVWFEEDASRPGWFVLEGGEG